MISSQYTYDNNDDDFNNIGYDLLLQLWDNNININNNLCFVRVSKTGKI